MTHRLARGIPVNQRAAAARLYWQAFRGKLGRVLGPDDRALRFLMRVIRDGQAVVALDGDDRLIGLAGFKTTEGGFASGTMADMQSVYGLLGASWRAGTLRLLGSEVDNDRFLIDGICVAPDWQGQGVGSDLLEALCAEAFRRGYGAARLDVVDSNPRARALYERKGFVAVRTESIGPLRHVFGFATATTMVRPLSVPG